MEFRNHTFSDIRYKNGPDTDPNLRLKYSAESIEDGTIKESKDKFDELPQPEFRELWGDLVEYWKLNLEDTLTDPENGHGIDWDYEAIRLYRVKIEWQNNKPVSVEYIAQVTGDYGETTRVATPPMSPTMMRGEIDDLEDLAKAAKDFLHGARAQQTLGFDDEEVSSDDSDDLDDLPFGD